MSNVVETYNIPNRPFTLDDVKCLFRDTYGMYPLSVKYVQKEFTFNDSGLQKILDHPIFVTAVYCDMDISKYDSDKKFYTFCSPQIISSVSNEKLKEGFQFGNKPFEPYGFWQTIAMFYTTAIGSKKKAGSNIPDELVFAPTNRNEVAEITDGKEVITYYGIDNGEIEESEEETPENEANEGDENQNVLLRSLNLTKSSAGYYKITIVGIECEMPFYPLGYWRAMTNDESKYLFQQNPSIFAIIDNQYEGLILFPEGYVEKSNAQYTIKSYSKAYPWNDDILLYNNTDTLFEISIEDFKIMQDNGARFWALNGRDTGSYVHNRGFFWTSITMSLSGQARMFAINKVGSVSNVGRNSNTIQLNSRTYKSSLLGLMFVHESSGTLKFKLSSNNSCELAPTMLRQFRQDVFAQFVIQNVTIGAGQTIQINNVKFLKKENNTWCVNKKFYVGENEETYYSYTEGASVVIYKGVVRVYAGDIVIASTPNEIEQGIAKISNTGESEQTVSIFFEIDNSYYFFGKYGYEDYAAENVRFTFEETQKQQKILKI